MRLQSLRIQKLAPSVFAFSRPLAQGFLLTESVSNSLYEGSPDQLPYGIFQRLQALEALEAFSCKLATVSSYHQESRVEDLFNISVIRAFQVCA